jgi:hypothetical protein
MVPQGIRFNDCFFTEPTRLSDWRVPKYAGLFVILAKDPNWAPQPYQPLYFGEFGNNTPEGLLSANQLRLQRSERDTILLVSVLPMPFSTTAQRLALRNELLLAHNSAWQAKEARAAVSGLPNHQLGELDKKPYLEQAAQILRLLSGANQILEPQPEPEPRRRIGFVP